MTEPHTRDYTVFDAELAGKAFDGRLLARLLRWVRPHWRAALLSGVLVLIASVLAILMPVIVSRVVIDGLLLQGPVVQEQPLRIPDFGMTALVAWLADTSGLALLLAACGVYLLCSSLWALTMHWHRLTMARAVLAALRDLRRDLFRHLETRPASFYDRVAVGRVMTRVTNDVEVLFQLLQGFGVLVGEFAPFFVALLLMLAIDPALTGLLLLALPVVAGATWVFRGITRRVYRAIRQSVSQMNQNLQENIAGMPVVQLSGREERNLARYAAINRTNQREENRAIDAEVLYGGFVDSMASAAIGAILWFGGGRVVQETISLGSLVLFTQFVDMLFRPIVAAGEQYNVLFRAMASLERIFQALDWDEQVSEPVEPVALPERLDGRIAVRDLQFAYRPGERVLQGITFDVRAGERLAIVGATGSGKSTFIRLLARLYEVPHGALFIDGIDVNAIATADLRRRIGVVLQDFHIFSGTVEDNISLGNPRIDRAVVERAARQVNAHRFIERLPEGYQTRLTERGQNLSQGQRQLLAFARVLASDPEILILDEATASIDTETELLIQAAVAELTAGRTSLIIAHRLQTIQDADRVLVMQRGRLAEIGTHTELLAHDGPYRTLHALQFQDPVVASTR